MTPKIKNDRASRLLQHPAPTLAALVFLLSSCSDHWDDFTPVHEQQPAPLAFTATVAPSETATRAASAATRADGSLVNRLMTWMYKTKDRIYYDKDGVEETASYQVGLFAAYTGAGKWTGTASPNFIYNLPMNIEDPDAKTRFNPLSYVPVGDTENGGKADSLRFWPNLRYTDTTDGNKEKYHRLTFWAYYPWNANVTADHGISIQSAATAVGDKSYGITSGSGMGSILYTMPEDASEQSDFMLSDLVPDCSRDTHPLNGNTPTPVQLRFHHMLAQVRLYAFIRGTDKIVWAKSDYGRTLIVKSFDDATHTVTLWEKDPDTGQGIGDTEITYSPGNDSYKAYVDAWGKTHTKGDATHPFAIGDSIPDDTPWLDTASPASVRWERSDITDISGNLIRAKLNYSMQWNNIHTQAIFTPHYDATTGKTTFSYEDVGTLGSATVHNYLMNPYWFRFKDNERVMLNETYMYDYFESTPAAKGERSENDYDGVDWSDTGRGANPLKYPANDDRKKYIKDNDYVMGSTLPRYEGVNTYPELHYNYAPCNIILAVPQVHNDNDVPHIIVEGKCKQATYSWNGSAYVQNVTDTELSGRVTYNMLNMRLKWESGFIYCYAFIDELSPGDDKVRGPESITVVFDPSKQTDQW